jgi:hypothetical protein
VSPLSNWSRSGPNPDRVAGTMCFEHVRPWDIAWQPVVLIRRLLPSFLLPVACAAARSSAPRAILTTTGHDLGREPSSCLGRAAGTDQFLGRRWHVQRHAEPAVVAGSRREPR